jgi:hypothetical protein
MKPVDGIDYGRREKLWTPKQGPEKDFPIINSSLLYYTQLPDRFKERSKITKMKLISPLL